MSARGFVAHLLWVTNNQNVQDIYKNIGTSNVYWFLFNVYNVLYFIINNCCQLIIAKVSEGLGSVLII